MIRKASYHKMYCLYTEKHKYDDEPTSSDNTGCGAGDN